MLLMSPYIITFLVVESIIVLFGFLALVFAFRIIKKYSDEICDETQFNLAKNGYLVSTIIFFILTVKIPLFLFFVWSMDSVSFVVPGAMCAAGIVDATSVGTFMFVIKILNLFFLSGWMLINYEDSKTKNSAFLKLKFKLFIPLFMLLLVEFGLEFIHFSSISLSKPVLCCSDIFRQVGFNEMKFWHMDEFILIVFYLLFILLILSAYYKLDLAVSLLTLCFMFSSIYAIIRFFSPYIYELPTHKCPFCMLQKDYNYIGYLIYILIFLGAVPGFFLFIMDLLDKEVQNFWYKFTIVFNSLLVILLSLYPISYYIKNGVWL